MQVTGATGFVGAHIVQQALEVGYRVRMCVKDIFSSYALEMTSVDSTARPAKVQSAKEQFEGKVEVLPVADLAEGDYSEALKGKRLL